MFIGQPPSWPDWIAPSQDITSQDKVTGSATLNSLQPTVEKGLLTVAGDTRKMGPIYGPTTIGGRVDIIETIGTYLYIRALLCIGEINQISSVKINDANYLTGDPTADPDYMGDWEDSAVWTALGGLPYAASAGTMTRVSGPRTSGPRRSASGSAGPGRAPA